MRWAILLSTVSFAALMFCISIWNSIQKSDENTDVLTQNIVRICPLCTNTETANQLLQKKQDVGQKLSAIELKNDPAIIQQLPYKVSGSLDVPQPTIERQSYNPNLVIRFSQVPCGCKVCSPKIYCCILIIYFPEPC